MSLSRLRQLYLCGLVAAATTIAPRPALAGDATAVNLRDSPAKATTPYNLKVVEEFRANDGKVGGRSTLLLLHTTGAKTGLPRLTPLAFLADGERLIVIASNGGAARNPAWYHNLVANPKVGVEVGSEQFYATATVTNEPERTALFEKMASRAPAFASYQKKAAPRVIPVIVLSRIP